MDWLTSRSKLIFVAGGLTMMVMLAILPRLAQGKSSFQPPVPDFASGEVLVKFKPAVSLFSRQRLLQQKGWNLLKVSPRSQLMRVRLAPGRETEAIAYLRRRPEVDFATYNYVIYALDTPNDPAFYRQWALHNTGQTGGYVDADIDAPEAWDIHTGGANVTIAILDTGVYAAHEDLQANMWLNEDEIPANNIDDDGNGYLDDYQGYDFYNNDSNPDDDEGHGTHVAGIAAARGQNGRGIAGVSWGAKIMPLKMLNSAGNGYLSDLEEAIYYAADNGAQLINMSLGASCGVTSDWYTVVQPAIDYAVSKNVLLVAAAGNSGVPNIFCPAALEGVIAVGATTDRDSRVWFSNYGPELDLAAPGDSIHSTYPAHVYSSRHPSCYTYAYCNLSGTSMATPHVAGLGALIWSYQPSLVQDDVRSILAATADDLGSAGWDQYYGHGRINAHRALAALVSFQTWPAQLTFLVDDHGGSHPASDQIQIISNDEIGISWTANITPAVSWLALSGPAAGTVSAAASPAELTLTASRPSTYGRYSTTVVVSGANSAGQSVGTRTTPINLSYVPELQPLYLPLLYRHATFEPDLTIESLLAAGDAVTVTIRNQGNGAVTDAFWVDLYFDPVQLPAVNLPWDSIAGDGLVWGVTGPLGSGESLTLTIGNAHYFPEYSSGPPLPVNVDVYGLVDSINYGTDYGAVRERDETNNLFGPVRSLLAGTEFLGPVDIYSRAGWPEQLPARQTGP